MEAAKPFRPIGVILLEILFLIFAAWNGLRVGETVFFWKTLIDYGTNPWYITLSGAIWLIVALILFWAFWYRKPWGRWAALAGILTYNAWYWYDRLVLQSPHTNWPFVLTANIIFLALVLIILISRKTRIFFKRDAHE
jgi:hypothetical protein